jgi:hypothetical protein
LEDLAHSVGEVLEDVELGVDGYDHRVGIEEEREKKNKQETAKKRVVK